MTPSKLLRAAALAVAILGRAGYAAPALYSDLTSFQAAAAASGITLASDSYEDLSQGFIFGPMFRNSHMVTTPADNVFIIDNVLDATDGTKSLGLSGPRIPVTYTFDQPIRAFAVDVVDALSILGGDFVVEIDGAAPVTLFSGQFGSRNRQFIGIIDTVSPFTSLMFSNTDIADSWTFDQVRFETAVPEPSAVALAGVGLALMGFKYTRRKNKGARP